MEEQAEQNQKWWQKARKPLGVFGIVVVCILIIALLAVIVMVYLFNVNVPGLRGKTLWDWLQLLIIPAVLAVGGYLFNYSSSKNEQKATQQRDQTERDIALDNQREVALQSYIDKISELLLDKHLRESQSQEEVRTIARVRTLTTLLHLDKERMRSVIQFLHESQLISRDKNIINLKGADLRYADLSRVSLDGANLSGAFLYYADLHDASLDGTNLSGAFLVGANLSGADLSGAKLNANLSGANLSGANLSGVELEFTNLSHANLFGATMPDGSIHP